MRGRHLPWSPEWQLQLLSSESAEAILEVDLTPVDHLDRRIGSAGEWTDLARFGRALRAGVSARRVLEGACRAVVSSPPSPLFNRIYVVLRGGAGNPPGWTDLQFVYRARVRGPGGEKFDPGSVSHSFPSRPI